MNTSPPPTMLMSSGYAGSPAYDKLRRTTLRQSCLHTAAQHSVCFFTTGLVVFAILIWSLMSLWNSGKALEQAQAQQRIDQVVEYFLMQAVFSQGGWENDPRYEQMIHDHREGMRDAMNRVALCLGNRFQDDPLLASTVHRTLGQVFLDLGESQIALGHLTVAQTMFQQLHGATHPNTRMTEMLMSRCAGVNKPLVVKMTK